MINGIEDLIDSHYTFFKTRIKNQLNLGLNLKLFPHGSEVINEKLNAVIINKKPNSILLSTDNLESTM